MLPIVQKGTVDPLLEFMRLLRPKATLFGGLEASGQWALSFRQRNDVLFCWVESGECHLFRQDSMPVSMRQGDFVLIRTDRPFVIASDEDAEQVDSEAAAAAKKGMRLQLGTGYQNPVVLHAGKFLFDTPNQDMLVGLLPSLVYLSRDDESSARIHALLAMNSAEAHEQRPGSAFVIAHLVELLLFDILRAATPLGEQWSGLLVGLSDPITAKALTAMHAEVDRSWTVATLARHCAVSRSTLAARFCSLLGIGPMAYLQRWRMMLAKDYLRSGRRSISEIAYAIGFKSQSAFSTAFTRAFGCSPTQFVAGVNYGVATGLDKLTEP